MVNWETFRNTLVAMITTLDTIDQCPVVIMRDLMLQSGCWDWEAVMDKLEASRLVAFDKAVMERGQHIIAITPKGRELAKDLRAIASVRI
jgi:hypothetical protein